MKSIRIQYMKTPLGELILGSSEDRLCLCDWRYRKNRDRIDRRIREGLEAVYHEENTPVTMAMREQLSQYLAGERQEFDVPILLLGSVFQKKVWNELLTIPFGGRMTYLELSRKVSNEKSIRAVAAANGANALSLIVPCHRIVGSKGELTGYAGGLPAKKKLLQLESDKSSPLQMELFE